MKSFIQIFNKSFASKSLIKIKSIKENSNTKLIKDKAMKSNSNNPKFKPNVMCQYDNILYNVQINNIKPNPSSLLNVFSLTSKNTKQSYLNYDLVYKDKYLSPNQNLNLFISQLNDNNPLSIYDERLSEGYFQSRNLSLKEYNSNFQFFIDRVYSGKHKEKIDNFINYQRMDDYLKIHNDCYSNRAHFDMYLHLLFSEFGKFLKLKKNLIISPPEKTQRTLTFSLNSNLDIIPFDLIIGNNFQGVSQVKDQVLLNKILWPKTYRSFDLLRSIARADNDLKKKYYLGVITDLKFWKYTFYIKNHDNSLENESNYLSSRVFVSGDSLDLKFINEMLNFIKTLSHEKGNFHNYKA